MNSPEPMDADPVRALEAVAARASAQMTGENFPVALRLLPRTVRVDLARVYAFARFVDDVGDEAPGGPDERLALLEVIGDDLRRLDAGAPRLGVISALRPLTSDRGVPLQPFLDLVEANRIDQRVAAYETFEDLLGYCRLSAAPIGQIVLHVAGAATPRNIADSDSVCAALQVLEHCQDVGEDARAGRVYLPGAEIRAAGLDPAELAGAATPAALRRVVAAQVVRSRTMLEAGRPLVGRLSGWGRFAVAGYVAGGWATADALDGANHDVLGRAVRPSKMRTVRRALRELRG